MRELHEAPHDIQPEAFVSTPPTPARALMAISPPPAPSTAASEFSSTLRTTTSSASGSLRTYRPGSIELAMMMLEARARSSSCVTTRVTAERSSSGSDLKSTRPRSRRTLSRIWVTIASMRARSASMRSMSVREACGGGARNAMVSSDSCRLASGVLNWCETRARKLSCSSSTRASARRARAITAMHTPSASRKNPPSQAYWLLRRCSSVRSACSTAGASDACAPLTTICGSNCRTRAAGVPASSSACAAAVCPA